MLDHDTAVDTVPDQAVTFQNSPTFVHCRAQDPHGLNLDEERLVVFCCSLGKNSALELLDQVASDRAPLLREKAAGLLGLARRDRLATFSRKFAPPPTSQAIRRLAEQLDGEPLWFAAAVCQRVAPIVRERLMAIPSIRDAWRNASAVHPALANHAFRFAQRALSDD